MNDKTFSDVYGDKIVLYEPPDGEEPDAAIGIDSDENAYVLDKDTAIEFATAILDEVGAEIGAATGARASEVSLNEALIRVAAIHKIPVTFRYVKSTTAPVEARRFVPKEVRTLADHVTFVGYDEDRDAFRSFRSDRIKGQVAL